MKIEVVRKLNEKDTIIVNELANVKTLDEKLIVVKDTLKKLTALLK